MMVGINWKNGVKIFSWKNFVLGLPTVITVIILLANMVYFFGSLDKGIPVLRKIVKSRTVGIVEEGEPQRPMVMKDYLTYPFTISSRIERYFYIPGILFLFLVWPLRRMRKINQSLLDYTHFYYIVPAALSWYILVWEHSDVHQVVGRYSFFLWMIFLAYFFIELYNYCLRRNKNTLVYFSPFILIFGCYGFLGINVRFLAMNIYRILLN